MVRDWIRNVFRKATPPKLEANGSSSVTPGGGTAQPTPGRSSPMLIDASDNPWGVRLLDVRPVTQTMLSTSADPQCAVNAISFGQDDGQGFVGQMPESADRFSVDLRYPADQRVADGVLFIPQQMEHKWALFVHRQAIICVRSWTRQVQAIAHFNVQSGFAQIYEMHGTLIPNDADPLINQRLLDFLIRSHALKLPYPVPLPVELALSPEAAAMWCMSQFGRLALFATNEVIPYRIPDRPLRTHSLLHIAVARGDIDAVRARLEAGDPVDLLAADGLAPIHWALASRNSQVLPFLKDEGADIDARSSEGATALMTAAQGSNSGAFDFLLAHGADPNARDLRGFTALHRAAELGKMDFVKRLLVQGADASLEAEGHTARSFAMARNETGVVALLDEFTTR